MIKTALARCHLLLLAIVVLISLPACGHKDMNQVKANSELEMTKDIDLGLILDTTVPLQLKIPITNRANRVITILEVAKDCSCTAVKIDKLKLAPGESATLSIVANLSGKKEFYEGNVIIESDAAEREDQIRVRGQITGQIRIRPSRATVLIGETPTPGCFSVFCDDQNGPWRYAGFTSDDPNLVVALTRRETGPTTSVYDGTVDLSPAGAAKGYKDFQSLRIAMTFINDRLGRHLELKYGVDVAARRCLTMDPPQILFLGKTNEQCRTVLVQSAQALRIDSVQCASPCIATAIHRIDLKSMTVDLVYRPSLAPGSIPENLECSLMSDGKALGSVPISIVEIP